MGAPIHTTTEHKIGTVTYFVVSVPSGNAAETLDKKVEKLIRKDILSERSSHVTARQNHSPLLQIEPGGLTSRGVRQHT